MLKTKLKEVLTEQEISSFLLKTKLDAEIETGDLRIKDLDDLAYCLNTKVPEDVLEEVFIRILH